MKRPTRMLETGEDPTMMKTRRVEYSRKVSRLFRNFHARFLKTLKRYATQPLDSEELKRVGSNVSLLLDHEVIQPGQALVDEQVLISYQAGQRRGAQFLKGVGIDAFVGIAPADERMLKILKGRNYAILKGITEDLSKTITNELTDGVLRGESIYKLTRRLREKAGITKARAESFARTETMYAFNTAMKAEYERYGVEEVEWLTAGDANVCAGCAALNGRVFPIDKAPSCPLHPNCRCTLIPLVE